MDNNCAVELRHITKRFGKVVANDSIDLTINRGEILSLLGENGSGKTTLMNMLAGIYFPDEGEIYVNGVLTSIRSPKDAFDNHIGMLLSDVVILFGIVIMIVKLDLAVTPSR